MTNTAAKNLTRGDVLDSHNAEVWNVEPVPGCSQVWITAVVPGRGTRVLLADADAPVVVR